MRAAWIEQRLAEGFAPALVWANGWALTALTAEEASAAFRALERDGRLTLPRGPESAIAGVLNSGSADAIAGRAFLLAGRPAEAVPILRRAAASCEVLYEAVAHVRATLDLGRALEELRDIPGACDAYGKVLAVWGKAKPRSVTAEKARASSKALGCP